MLPSTLEDYLEAIFTIAGDGGRSVGSQEVVAALGTEEAAAGTTITSLVREGYLEQLADDTVRLTEKGLAVASRVARKHRVLQCFLTEMLGVDADAADKEACTLEHGISDETIDRLSSYMDSAPPGHAGRCPACEICTLERETPDEAIDRSSMSDLRRPPGRARHCRGRDACTLLDCKEGDTVRVAMIRGPRRNRRLLDLGIFPGEIVQIRRKLPNRSVVVRVKGCDIAISPEIAMSIIVESCP